MRPQKQQSLQIHGILLYSYKSKFRLFAASRKAVVLRIKAFKIRNTGFRIQQISVYTGEPVNPEKHHFVYLVYVACVVFTKVTWRNSIEGLLVSGAGYFWDNPALLRAWIMPCQSVCPGPALCKSYALSPTNFPIVHPPQWRVCLAHQRLPWQTFYFYFYTR